MYYALKFKNTLETYMRLEKCTINKILKVKSLYFTRHFRLIR